MIPKLRFVDLVQVREVGIVHLIVGVRIVLKFTCLPPSSFRVKKGGLDALSVVASEGAEVNPIMHAYPKCED